MDKFDWRAAGPLPFPQGRVFLVGAGPGDPDLITVKGVNCLRQADLVLYDRLANPALLDYCRPDAEQVFVGKEPRRHRLAQEEINDLLVQGAWAGLIVVRLKGGDPFVFGRGGEEALVLAAAGIPFEVVPGISSAIAVPAYAGIPVTHRRVSPLMTLITGHTCDPEDPAPIAWDELPRQGTLVVLMGVGRLAEIAADLIAAGRPPTTPCALIRNGTLPDQEVVHATLETIAAAGQKLRPPATLVVGEVTALARQIDWFAPATLPLPPVPV